MRPLSRPQQLQGEACSCRWWAKRGRSTTPGGWHRRPAPFPDYPLAGIAHPRRPPSARQAPHCCSQAGSGRARERPKAGCRARGVSMRSRHDSGGCPQGLGRCLAGRINQNRLVLFETPPSVSVLAPAPAAPGRGGRGNRETISHFRHIAGRRSAKFAGRSTLYSILYTMPKTGNSIP